MPVHSITDNSFVQRMQRMNVTIHPTDHDDDDQPTPDQPGHPEYHRRVRVELAVKRLEAATPYMFRSATATHPDVVAWADRVIADAQAAAAGTDQRTAGTLLITGGLGVGKTHQAYGALRRIAEAGLTRFEFLATTAPQMYELMRPNGSEKGPEFEARRLERIPLLLLDDVGVERCTEFTEEATYRIFNARYTEMRPTILTSNLPIESDRPGRPDLMGQLGARVVSRLAQTATHVPLIGDDRRYL